MPCHSPNIGRPPTLDSKIKFFNHYPDALKEKLVRDGDAIPLPCGQCVGCRLDNARGFAVRSYHESSMFHDNCFLTLTYSPDKLESNSLIPRDFQLFAKKLRKFSDGYDRLVHKGKIIKPIRMMYAGEYGDVNLRPHFHACVYNFDFKDKEHWFTTQAGHKIYTSPTLNKIWGKGIATIGEVTFDSASYTARYILKKVKGDDAKDHYQGRYPEFARHPSMFGLGKKWLEKYWRDVYPHDYVVVMTGTDSSFKMKPPRYYDEWLKLNRPDVFEEVKIKRLEKSEDSVKDFSIETLAKNEKKEQKRMKELVRVLDSLN